MYLLNEQKDQDIGIWSMRNIRKLFRRLQSQQIKYDSYIKISPEHQIVFFILQSIIPEKRIEVLEKLLKIMEKAFNLDDSQKKNISNCINTLPKIRKKDKKDGEQLFLMKGECGILIPPNLESIINSELPTLLESLFYILFCHENEPLILVGPSGFKTYLAQNILTNSPIINLYQETSISQLLGSITLTNTKKAKSFYLRKILEICHINKEDEEKSYLNYLDYIEVINKTDEEIEKEIEIEKKKMEKEKEEQENNVVRSQTVRKKEHESIIDDLSSISDDDDTTKKNIKRRIIKKKKLIKN